MRVSVSIIDTATGRIVENRIVESPTWAEAVAEGESRIHGKPHMHIQAAEYHRTQPTISHEFPAC